MVRDYCRCNNYKFLDHRSGQRYHYATISVLREETRYFMKIASTVDSAKNIDNEYCFASAVNNQAETDKKKFCAPIMHLRGDLGKHRYYISESIPHNCLTENRDNFIKYLPEAVELLAWMRTFAPKLPMDDVLSLPGESARQYALAIVEKNARVLGKKIGPIMSAIYDTPFRERRLAYCDFKPWHTYTQDGRFGVFDGEYATSQMVEHYDAASCHSRLFCVMEKPELANHFLEKYIEKLLAQGQKRDEVIEELRGVLAIRSVMQMANAKDKITPLNHLHMDSVIEGSLFP